MGHIGHMRHMRLNAPASQRRGKSVSDGFSRTSLRVFAVNTLAPLFRVLRVFPSTLCSGAYPRGFHFSGSATAKPPTRHMRPWQSHRKYWELGTKSEHRERTRNWCVAPPHKKTAPPKRCRFVLVLKEVRLTCGQTMLPRRGEPYLRGIRGRRHRP